MDPVDTVAAAAERPERRKHPRHGADDEVSLLLVKQGVHVSGHLVDMSLKGCRMRFPQKFTAAIQVRVELAFKVHGIAFRFCGVIEWAGGNMIGIRFVDMTSRREEELVEVLAELAEDAAAAAQKLAAEMAAPAAESAKQGAAKQPVEAASQKQPGSGTGAQQAPLPPPAPARGAAGPIEQKPAGAPHAAKPTGRDRRTQGRHDVDTSAAILLVNVASRLHGRILNLSAGGCRIRTDERFPVGIYTRVETEFNLEGMPFRLGGVVQAIQDRHHVGIRFLDMSDRRRQQIEQLIDELEELREREKTQEGQTPGQHPPAV